MNIGSGGKGVTRLERLNRSEFGNKLVEAGISEQEAFALARQSGGSFTVFKRHFSSSPEIKRPKWGESAAAADLAPLLLVGAWRDNSPADQAIVSKIASKSYPDCVKILNQWRKDPDSPVRLIGGIWEFVSPLDAWGFLHHALSSQHLDEFEKGADEVLGENNPIYDLPKEERWQAAVKGKVQKYSPEIRHGLAQTLAVIATQPTPDELANAVPLPQRANRTIAKLLPQNASWIRWASLGSLLPLLAEAAPNAVLKAIEPILHRRHPSSLSLFWRKVLGLPGGRSIRDFCGRWNDWLGQTRMWQKLQNYWLS